MEKINRKVLISKAKIKKRISELAKEISKDYNGKNPVFIGVLKGGFIFMADLIREIDPMVDPELDFISVSSYGSNKTKSGGEVKLEKDLRIDINGRHVILVDDIVDYGYNFDFLLRMLKTRHPKSIKTCVLLSKPERRVVNVPVDYAGFVIPDKWVEGYGLDTDERFRNLPEIWYRPQ